METPDNQQDSQKDDLVFTTTPNLLTLSRILFVPLVVISLLQKTPGWDWVAAILFAVASITDYFDGYLARVQKSESVYGKLMDPLADKFLVVSCLIILQELGRINPIVNILLICRELAITGLRALASAEGVVIAASDSAKWKTATQMVAIPFIMIQPKFFGIPLYEIGQVLLLISLAISLWSARNYVAGFFVGLKETRKARKLKKKLSRETRRAEREARRAALIKKAESTNQ